MAKNGKKKNKAAKGAGETKIPKEVAGVKVPKELRRLGKKAVKAARSPVVSELVAGALLSAAAALRQPARPAKAPNLSGSGGGGGDRGAGAGGGTDRGGGGAGSGGGRRSAELGDALRAIAFDFARSALDGIEEGKKAKRRAAAAADAGSQPPGAQSAGNGGDALGGDGLEAVPGRTTVSPRATLRR